jgi:hypothetical protein
MLTDAQIKAYISSVIGTSTLVNAPQKAALIANFMRVNGISAERVAQVGNISVGEVNAYLAQAASPGSPGGAGGGAGLLVLAGLAAALLLG